MKVIFREKRGIIILSDLNEDEFKAYKEEIEMTREVFRRFNNCKSKEKEFKEKVKELNK